MRHSAHEMPGEGYLREGLLALGEAARAFLPLRGLGVVRPDGPEHRSLVYADAFGLTAYHVPVEDLMEALRAPSPELRRIPAAELAARLPGPVETHLLLIGLPEEMRDALGVRQLVTIPLSATDSALVLGLATSDPLTAEQASKVQALAARATRELERPESAEDELERLRRLEAADALLPALLRVLDIRQVFDRVSALTKDVLPHDVMTLGFFSPDLAQVSTYAHTSSEGLPEIAPMPYPPALMKAWVYNIVDDLPAHPIEHGVDLTRAGGRSSVRVALRLDAHVLGGLNFTSRETATYTTADVAIARRIADYVALALSHHRLAEEGRRNEELRVRAEKMELLDELLASVTGTGELPDVFDRISNTAQKVLAHDALVLTAVLPGGRKAKVYASKAPDAAAFPDVVEVPPLMLSNPDWEYDLIDDLQARADQRKLEATQRGYRAALRVPIRIDSEYVAGVSFLSMAPSTYGTADVAVARRIADKIALSFARERRQEASRRADEATARASELESRVRALTEELNARSGYRRVIGDSPCWRQVLTQATQVAATETTVLLLGESGTGKEVVARFVHGGSARNGRPFVALNCAALPDNLLEAELFGYERGAFTGAVQSKPGQLEQAAGGTLFLDEVAEMSPSAQAKFLRVLQEREFQRLGGTRVLKTDARVVAATNRDLHKAMDAGEFREDLYYRLNVFAIRLPPLRERRDDILPLSDAFVSEVGRSLGRPPAGVSREAQQALLEYDWPGNVRELRNVLERAAILADGGLIAAEHLSLRPLPGATPRRREPKAASAPAVSPPSGDLKTVERAMIEQALHDARFNKSDAAKRLGLTRAQLYVRLRRHGLE